MSGPVLRAGDLVALKETDKVLSFTYEADVVASSQLVGVYFVPGLLRPFSQEFSLAVQLVF